MHLSGRPLAKPYRTRAFFLRIFLPACKKLVVLGHFSFQFELRFFLIWSWSIPVGASKIRCSTRAFAVSKAAVTDHSRHGNAKCEQDSKCSCPQGHVGSNPTASAIKALKTLCFRGFFFCSGSIYFGENNSNGALGAPLCGARLILYHTHYTRKMYTVVPQWCPELLKSYEKQRGAIKRYCCYSSISLLFFFAFFDVSCPASFPVTVVFGCSAL